MPSSAKKISSRIARPPATKVIAIANQKGGVGKTTTTVNCAWLASELDSRPPLVIELCPQGNASITLYGDDYESLECVKSFDLFQDNAVGQDILTTDSGIGLISASNDLADVDSSDLEGVLKTFRDHVLRLKETNDWSWIIIDTPPSLGVLQLAALAAADYAVIPIGLDRYSLSGLTKLLDCFDMIDEMLEHSVEILGVLPNMVNAARKEQVDALAQIRESFGELVLPVCIHDRAPIADAIDRGHPVWKHTRTGNARVAAKEVKQVITDILMRAR